MDFMHISGQKEAIWNTIFSVFERWRPPPQTSRGPVKLPPPSPLSTGLLCGTILSGGDLSVSAFIGEMAARYRNVNPAFFDGSVVGGRRARLIWPADVTRINWARQIGASAPAFLDVSII